MIARYVAAMLNEPTKKRPDSQAVARITIRGLRAKQSKTFTVYGGTFEQAVERAGRAFSGKQPKRELTATS